jgi:hypothetical protein
MTAPREPRTASAVTRAFLHALDTGPMPVREVSDESGVHVNSFYNWRTGKAAATVINLEAALAVLGLELCIRPINSSQGD